MHVYHQNIQGSAQHRRARFFFITICVLCCLLAITTSAYSASKTILVLGDSLSAEYGIARGTGWVALLDQRLKKHKRDFTVINASVSGETTSGGKTRLSALLEQFHPAIVIIELGGNDGLRGLPLAASEANLMAMIGNAQKAKAKVLLLGMRMPPNYGPDYTERFFAMYGKLAKESHAALLDFFLQGVAEKPDLFQADRIHPTALAHPVLLNNVWPFLEPLLR